MREIIIFTEKNHTSGLGHYKRIFGLKKFLEKKEKKVKLILKNKKNIRKKIHVKNKILIFDFKNYAFLKKINKDLAMNTVVTIENFQNSIYDLNVSIFDHKPHLKGNRVSGLKYAMIRPKIINKLNQLKNNALFVNLGSTENKKKLVKLIRIIKPLKSNNLIKYVFFITKFYKEFSYLNNNFIKFKSNFLFLHYFTRCKFHIVNSGVTALESIFLKSLFVSLPQNKKESRFAHYLKKNENFFIGLNKITIKNLLKFNLLKKKKIIDDKGYERIYYLIKKLKLSKNKKRF